MPRIRYPTPEKRASTAKKKKQEEQEEYANAKEAAREAAEKRRARYFRHPADGARYATATGERAPLSIKPSLEALQRRIDYERTIYGDPSKDRLARQEKEKEDNDKRINQNRERALANPSLLKGGFNYKKGGKVRGAGIARKGVRPVKIR
tara:strand:+ start:10605 stop:11054 length:450 start_codon:yes stop_codon:yes gene_type:complete